MTDIEFKEEVIERLNGIESVLREIRDTAPRRFEKAPLGDVTHAANDAPTINLPQPKWLHRDPGSIVLQFSKHKGKRLDEIDDGMLLWLIQKWTPKPAPDGKLYRSDEILQEAIRQIWHTKQRTLAGSFNEDGARNDVPRPDVREPAKPKTLNPSDVPPKPDEDCPF